MMKTLLAVLAVLPLSTVALADWNSSTVTVPVDFAGNASDRWTVPIKIAKFNPSRETVTRVLLRYALDTDLKGEFEYLGSNSIPEKYAGPFLTSLGFWIKSASITQGGGGMINPGFAKIKPFDGALDFMGPSSMSHLGHPSPIEEFRDPRWMADLVGPGLADINLEFFFGFQSGIGVHPFAARAKAKGKLTIRAYYEYTPN